MLAVHYGDPRVTFTIAAEPGGTQASSASSHMRSSTRALALLLTVNYKSEQSTLNLLASLERLNGFESLDVVIADNCSGEGNISRLRQAIATHSNVQLLVSVSNRGYFGAAKLGLDTFLAQGNDLPEWIIVCNPDVIIDDQEFLPKLHLHDSQSAGVVAPRVRLMTGIDQNPFMRRRPGRIRRATLQLIHCNYLFARAWDWLSRKKRILKVWNNTPAEVSGPSRVYAAHGSFFIFSRRFFEAGGYLDDELFLYGEEIAVAEICRSLALPIIFAPELRVWHDEHTSTGRVISRFSYDCQRKALQHLRDTYFAKTSKSRSKVGFGPLRLPSE